MTLYIDLYFTVIIKSLPDLSVPEWCCVADALGADWKFDERASAILAEEAAAVIDERGLDSKWAVDGERLNGILSSLPFEGRMAVGEVVGWCWEANPEGDLAHAVADILSRLSRIVIISEPLRPRLRLSPDRM